MGMYDDITFEYPFPDKKFQKEVFQTKDLGSNMDEYVVTRDGRLKQWGRKFVRLKSTKRFPIGNTGVTINHELVKTKLIDMNFHGVIDFYTARGKTFYEYTVKFTDGRLVEIKKLGIEK